MEVPKRLYKYRSGSAQDITNLSAAKLWFSNPARFNDPFDCAYKIAFPELKKADCVALLKRFLRDDFNESVVLRLDDEVLREQVANGLTRAVANVLGSIGGVCCFSAVPDNLLMWGHYSSGHLGFCLEFDTTREPLFKKARRVQYAKSFPSLCVEKLKHEDHDQVFELVLTKADCWEYEVEWRALHSKADLAYGYDRTSLTGIYFGAKMPEDEMQMIACLLERTDTKLYRMRVSENSFELVPEAVAFTPIDYRARR